MRLLIVRLGALGDLVTSMAVLQFIKKKHPSVQIDWLVDEKFKAVLEHHPHVNTLHTVSLKSQKNALAVAKEILKMRKQKLHYDWIIDMQGLIKSAFLSKMIHGKIVGFDSKSVKESLASIFYHKKVSIGFEEHILKRNFALLKPPLQIELSYQEIMDKEPYLFYKNSQTSFKSYLDALRPNVLVVLGGSWPSKIYPKEQLIHALEKLSDYQLLVLWSDEEERKRALWLKEKLPTLVLLPKISLNDLKALISQVDLVLGNDTGPTHMAWALNKPSVTLLGCTSITRIAVNKCNVAITSGAKVNPCKINKKDLSINSIDPNYVAKAVKSLLNQKTQTIQPPPKTMSLS